MSSLVSPEEKEVVDTSMHNVEVSFIDLLGVCHIDLVVVCLVDFAAAFPADLMSVCPYT